jgi:hypothetical protein
MPLGPLHATCVQPAPKSRFAASGLSRTKIEIEIEIVPTLRVVTQRMTLRVMGREASWTALPR